ncbi:MAG: hypothetical protein ACYC27_03365 [Armatimonadota bacterium]
MNGKSNCGTYKVSGSDLYFTGNLKAWDNGHGFVKDGVPYWFTYAKTD